MSEFLEGSPRVEQVSNEQARKVIESNQAELTRRRERGELNSEDFGFEDIVPFNQIGYPISQKDVGNRPIVITAEELGELGVIKYIAADGTEQSVDSDSLVHYEAGEKIIIFPEDLGN